MACGRPGSKPVTELILASASPARRQLLANAGIEFSVLPADLDERAAAAPLLAAGAPPADIAQGLAAAKAASVSQTHPTALVIGADQVLEFEGGMVSKPGSMDAARRQLLDLSGKPHALHSAVSLARSGAVLWDHCTTAHLVMRDLSPQYVGQYLAAEGEAVLQSVGAYQLEGRGVQLFQRVDGDFFTILGLPLLPLLAALRDQGILP